MPDSGGRRPPATPNNGLGTASLIVAIIAVATMLVPFIFVKRVDYPVVAGLLIGSILVGVLALGLGIAANSRVKAGRASNRGSAIAGVALGCVTVVGGILFLVLGIFGAWATPLPAD